MALSEFFPYGAPELLDGAPARMARSTMTATLLVATIVVSLGAMLARQPSQRILDDIAPSRFWIDPLQEPAKHYETQRVPTTAIAKDPHATPRIVEKDLVKESIPDRPILPEGPAGDASTRTDAGPGTRSDFGPIAVRDPEPGDYVLVDEYPAPIRCAEPVYPDLGRSAGVEGTVRVLMLVGMNGKVERAIIAPKGSIPMLDQSALDAALTCVFTPALANGHPVKVWVSQNYRFSLHSAP